MRRNFAVLAVLLAAGCARADSNPADSTVIADASEGVTGQSAPPDEVQPPAGPPAPAPSQGSVGAVHEVRMVGDANGYRFEPSTLTITTGDAVRFIVISGEPHNVVFDGAGLSSATQTQLDRNFSERSGPLATAMLNEAGEAVTVSFSAMPEETYSYSCSVHDGTGMRGTITVQ